MVEVAGFEPAAFWSRTGQRDHDEKQKSIYKNYV